MPWKAGDEVVEFEGAKGLRISDSGKALLVEHEDFGKTHQAWVPLGQISEDSEVYKADTDGVLIVTLWWAKTAGVA